MSGRRGMTLVELLCALMLLVALVVGVGGFFFQMVARRDRLALVASQQRDTALVLDRLESSLMHALAVGPSGEPGVSGDSTSLTVITRGVWPMLEGDGALDGAVSTMISFDERARLCSFAVEGAGLRGGAGFDQPVMREVERVRFRYSDGRRWTESFDSLAKGGLPIGVEVSVWFAAGPRDEETDPEQPGMGPGDEPASEFEDPFSPLEDAMEFTDDPMLDPFAEDAWTPREPDHVRFIGVPDAPDWQERDA